MALYFRENFGGRNYKIGPLARVVDLAPDLGHPSWLCCLVAFMCLDVVVGGGGVGYQVGLVICQTREAIKPMVIDNICKLLRVL